MPTNTGRPANRPVAAAIPGCKVPSCAPESRIGGNMSRGSSSLSIKSAAHAVLLAGKADAGRRLGRGQGGRDLTETGAGGICDLPRVEFRESAGFIGWTCDCRLVSSGGAGDDVAARRVNGEGGNARGAEI